MQACPRAPANLWDLLLTCNRPSEPGCMESELQHDSVAVTTGLL